MKQTIPCYCNVYILA